MDVWLMIDSYSHLANMPFWHVFFAGHSLNDNDISVVSWIVSLYSRASQDTQPVTCTNDEPQGGKWNMMPQVSAIHNLDKYKNT